jgi:hypothetical protein
MAKGLNRLVKRRRDATMHDNRRARIAALKVQGYTLDQIQAKLAEDGCVNPHTGHPWSIGQIHNDLKLLDARWQAEALQDVGEWKRAELERIDQIEKEARKAWDRGIGLKRKTIQEKTTGPDGEGTKASVVTEDLNGDARYLKVMLDCQERRAKLMGLDAASKTEVTGKDGAPIELSDAEKAKEIEALLLIAAERAKGSKG